MSPFLRPDAVAIDEMLADGAVELLRDRAADAVNVSALARWMGVTRQTLSERLWDPNGARHRIMRLTVLAFADRWLAWTGAALLADPPVPALPHDEAELHGVRVWAALAELARGEAAAGRPDPSAVVVDTRVRERVDLRERMTSWIGAAPSEEDLIELAALTDGLRASLAAAVPDVTLDVANRLLVRRLAAMRRSAFSGGRTGTLPSD